MTLHPEAQRLADYILSNIEDDKNYRLSLGLDPDGYSWYQAVEEAIASYAEQYSHDPADDILPGWCVGDIYEVVKDYTKGQSTVSREDAIAVLERAYKRMDANYGMSWDILWIHVQDLVREGAIQFIPNEEVEGDEDQ